MGPGWLTPGCSGFGRASGCALFRTPPPDKASPPLPCESAAEGHSHKDQRGEHPAMNHEERQVISDIFQRLRQVEGQSRDPEAERFIAEKVREQPYAPYAMAQSLFVQEQALNNLNAEVQRLRAE